MGGCVRGAYRRCVLRVRVLGEFAVERDGERVVLSGGPARLLAFLAVCRGLHPRDAVSARFWPDSSPAAARTSLRAAVFALRRAAGDDVLAASRCSIGLSDEVWVDVVECTRATERGDLTDAAALCRGVLLADLGDDWACDARAEQHLRHGAVLDALIEAARARGDLAAAVRASRQRCQLDPLDEPAHVVLLRLLTAAEDRAGGLAAARDFVERLRVELGVAPGPAIRAVLAELRGPQVTAPAADRTGGHRPMFGRSVELAAVMSVFSAARDGRGHVVLITGEAGIGKTRLVNEVAWRVRGNGARVAVGAGVGGAGAAPLAVWQELACELVNRVPAPPASASWPAELGRLSPDLAAALGRVGVPPPVAAPELERLRIFDAVLRLVEWAASERPLLLVAEDVHRADRFSLSLCAHIARRLAGLPVLFLLTRRDRPSRPETDALLADAAGRGVEVREIDLGPLEEAELAAVTRSVAALPDAAVRQVVAAAEGNPLLAVEQARTLHGRAGSFPTSLRAVVRAALGQLPRSARELAEGLAVAGRVLSSAEIDALVPGDPIKAELQVLETGLVSRDGDGLRFRHALLAEAARADVGDPRRRHEQLAEAVEMAAEPAGDQVAAEVAGHLRAAGRDDLAGPRWRRAARHARSLGALLEAASFWTEAVRCSPDDPEPRLELAEVYAWCGRRSDFEREWEAAIELVAPAHRAAAWSRRGNVLRSVLCHPSAGLVAYERARALLPVDADPALRAEVALGLAQIGAAAGDPTRTEELLDEFTALVTEPDPAMVVDFEAARILWLIRLGRFTELEALAAAAATTMDAADRPDQAFAALVSAACGLAAGGDLGGALRTADLALRLTRGVPVLTLPCLAARAHLMSRLGRHDEATAAARAQMDLAERLDSPAFVALASNDAGLVALAAGRPAEAADLLHAALAGGARISRPASRLARAEALAAAGRPGQAAAELRAAALEPVLAGDQPWALVPRMARVQGLVALARGDRDTARRRLTESVAGWRRMRPPLAGEEIMASLVDLGRPPVVGLVDPNWELARLQAELTTVDGSAPCPASR